MHARLPLYIVKLIFEIKLGHSLEAFRSLRCDQIFWILITNAINVVINILSEARVEGLCLMRAENSSLIKLFRVNLMDKKK